MKNQEQLLSQLASAIESQGGVPTDHLNGDSLKAINTSLKRLVPVDEKVAKEESIASLRQYLAATGDQDTPMKTMMAIMRKDATDEIYVVAMAEIRNTPIALYCFDQNKQYYLPAVVWSIMEPSDSQDQQTAQRVLLPIFGCSPLNSEETAFMNAQLALVPGLSIETRN